MTDKLVGLGSGRRYRWFAFGALVSLLIGCSSGERPPAESSADAAPHTTATASASGPKTADKHFAAPREYLGACLKEGRGAGGCYKLTFQPDGTASRWLLDAAEPGTYEIEGNKIRYRAKRAPADPEVVITLVTTDGFATLNEEGAPPGGESSYRLQP
ncbi:MAG: hypothetical protein HOW73_46460 [Polyangiaceae bacterium]|nr:hypothetical protein [Polyangiaceae bacterium]